MFSVTPSIILGYVPYILTGGGVLVVGWVFCLKLVLTKIHHSLGIAPPTKDQIEEEKQENHALFRFLPILSQRLAWRELGEYPTPIHTGSITPVAGGSAMKFYIKREDLSSRLYGGNKVRTLQHQVAVCEAKDKETEAGLDVIVLGTGGSNQVIATVVHGLHRFKINVVPVWMEPDLPDVDNTLNMLSTLSFPVKQFITWATKFKVLKTLIKSLFINDGSVVLPPGGNNPCGVFGQMGGILELVEQIQRDEVPDPDGIFLAIGSSCTITGIIMGIALVRTLNIPVLNKEKFQINGIIIHHGIAAANRMTGLYHKNWSRHIPLTIRHSITSTSNELIKLGGPDLKEEAFKILANNVKIHDEKDIVGKYGGHSDRSRNISQKYDETGVIRDPASPAKEASHLWLCGHFCAKAFEMMVQEWQLSGEDESKNFLFWQTKSNVQPKGDEDEWIRFQDMPDTVKAWGDKGKAESRLRPGKIDSKHGSQSDYDNIMTKVT